jgi:hypothetical protein
MTDFSLRMPATVHAPASLKLARSWPWLAVERVVGVIPEELHFGMRRLHAIYLCFWDVGVALAERQHDRNFRSFP